MAIYQLIALGLASGLVSAIKTLDNGRLVVQNPFSHVEEGVNAMARVSIEDCQKAMPNRFALVMVASNRTRQLMGSSEALVETKNKHAVTALREIAEKKVVQKGEISSSGIDLNTEIERLLN
jgi:DNA-directed RNA polymerase subunit omega